MKCNKHSEVEAAGACVGCGNLFCEDCLVQVNGKNYCKDCFADNYSNKNEVSNNNVGTSNISVLKVVLGCISIMICLSMLVKIPQVLVLMDLPAIYITKSSEIFMWGHINVSVPCIMMLVLSIISITSKNKLNKKVIIVMVIGLVLYIGSVVFCSMISDYGAFNITVTIKYIIINALIFSNYSINK